MKSNQKRIPCKHLCILCLQHNKHSESDIFQMCRPSERRHSSSSKPPSSYASSPAFTNSRSKGNLGGSGSTLARPSSANSSVPTKIFKSTKEKLPHRKPHFPFRVPSEERCVCVFWWSVYEFCVKISCNRKHTHLWHSYRLSLFLCFSAKSLQSK